MAKKQPKPEEPAGESAPAWIVSFADLVTLMMSFFVVLYALKQGGPKQQMEMAAAIKAQFDYQPAPDSTDPLDLMVLHYKTRPRPQDEQRGDAEAPAQGPDGHHPQVQTIRTGNDITEGGAIMFGPGSATVDEASRKTIHKLAELLRGHNNVLMIKGHVSADELSLRPDDVNGMGLSYQRANAVANLLAQEGIERRVLRPVACGPFEPVKVQAYDANAQRVNRRVEVFSTDTVATDFVPVTLVPAVGTEPGTDGTEKGQAKE